MSRLKRVLLIVPLVFLLTMFIGSGAFAAESDPDQAQMKDQTVTFNIGRTSYTIGENTFLTDIAPYIKDGRTMVPVAFVAPALGTEPAHWDPVGRVVTIKKGDQAIQITIGSEELLINGRKMQMDTAAEIKDIGGGGGRTMLPIAFIARALEVGYEWDATAQAVTFYGYNQVYAEKGTFGPDSGQESLQGNVVVKAEGVTLQNMLVKGNLIIDREVGQGTVVLSNLTVKGTTFIRGGGPDSIYLTGGQYGSIHIQNVDGKVRVVARDMKNAPVVIAEGAAGEEVILAGRFASIHIEGAGIVVTLQGESTVQMINIADTADNATLNINFGSSVDHLVLNSNTAVRGSGTVRHAEINAEGVTFTNRPEQQTVAEHISGSADAETKKHNVPIQSLVINTESRTIAVGNTLLVEYTIIPVKATHKKLHWTSDAETVATVNSTGLVTAVGPGTATITATASKGGRQDSITIPVLSALGGTVGIVGTTEYGELLGADLSGLTYNPSAMGDILQYLWKRDGMDIEGETAETYTLTEADLGARITLTVSADGIHALGSVTSEPTEVVEKAYVAAPAAPELLEKTPTSITLLSDPAMEYSINDGPWQDSGEFTGLAALTTYTFKCRVKETATHKASDPSEGVSITTNPPVMDGTVTISGSPIFGELLTANAILNYTPDTEDDVPTYQWKRSGLAITGATGTTYTLAEADVGQTISVTVTADGINATGSISSEPTAIIDKAAGPAAPPAPVLLEKTATSISSEPNAQYEYTMDDGATWQTENVFAGLSPLTEYTFKVRVKETATHYASALSVGAVIMTYPPALGGTVTITGTLKFGEVLTAVPALSYTPPTEADVPTYQWKRNGIAIEGATVSTYILAEADVGKTITVIVSADGSNAMGSVTSEATGIIDKADGPDAPEVPILVTKTQTTVTLEECGAAYEYSHDDGESWQNSAAFTDLIPGDVYSFRVRIKETSTHYASAPSAALEVRTVPTPPEFIGAQISPDGEKIIISFDKEMAEVAPDAPAGFNAILNGVDNPIVDIQRNEAEPTQYELTLAKSVHINLPLTVAYDGESVCAADDGVLQSFASQTVDTTTRTYELGDLGPAGGFIFYNEGTGSFKYLEAAPASTEWYGKVYGELNVSDGGAYGRAVGTGQANTTKIVNAHPEATDRAAQLCDALVVEVDGVVYDDWFLPSIDELYLIYVVLKDQNTRVVDGGFSKYSYWSSTEHDYTTWAWYVYFDDTVPEDYEYRIFYGGKSSSVFYTRAVRAF
jgi:hypothetical protein